MESGTVVRLNTLGPQGQELMLVVDFSTRQASLVVVDPKTGSISVREVQDYTKPGA